MFISVQFSVFLNICTIPIAYISFMWFKAMYLVKLYNIFYDREISRVTMNLSAYLIKDSFIIFPPILGGKCSIEKNVVGL